MFGAYIRRHGFSRCGYYVCIEKGTEKLDAQKTRNVWRTYQNFVLWFYGPVNSMGSCRARSVYLATRLLGRLSPLSG